MFVKICGTTNLEDARLAVELGADALGFIFAPSKRRVTVEQVAAMTRELPAGVMRVGVFTERDVELIVSTVRAAGLNAVQMHWAYEAEKVRALRDALGAGVSLLQVVGFPIAPEDEGEARRAFEATLGEAMRDSQLDFVLLDAVKGGASGGLGEAFSWTAAAPMVKAAKDAAIRVPRLIVAGGLRAENVAEAIGALTPWGVDVVTGVEAEPGKKDPERLRAFIAAARLSPGSGG